MKCDDIMNGLDDVQILAGVGFRIEKEDGENITGTLSGFIIADTLNDIQFKKVEKLLEEVGNIISESMNN